MSSVENDMKNEFENNKEQFENDRLSIPTLKYFWQASPLTRNRSGNIPKFLRSIKEFEYLSDYELKQFSGFLHQRIYRDGEKIISEGQSGFGFYIIQEGTVEIFARSNKLVEGESTACERFVTNLSKYEFFGELALLETQNRRNATVKAKGRSILLAIYKPDFEELISRYPVIGAKFLQAISSIVAARFNNVAQEITILKDKIVDLEARLESNDK